MNLSLLALLLCLASFIIGVVTAPHLSRPRRDIYRCVGPDHKGAECDLTSKLWDAEREGAQNAIEMFRHCDTLFVQKENEHLSQFYSRLPKQLAGSCLVNRNRPQNP